jgi:hypothetical protein
MRRGRRSGSVSAGPRSSASHSVWPLRVRTEPAGPACGVRSLGPAPRSDRQRHLRRLPHWPGLRATPVGAPRTAGRDRRRRYVRSPGRGDGRLRAVALGPRGGGDAQRQCRRLGVGPVLGHRDRGRAAPPPADAVGNDHDRNQSGADGARRAGPGRHDHVVAGDLRRHRPRRSDVRSPERACRPTAAPTPSRAGRPTQVAMASRDDRPAPMPCSTSQRSPPTSPTPVRPPATEGWLRRRHPAVRPHRRRWAGRTADGSNDPDGRSDSGRSRQRPRGQLRSP